MESTHQRTINLLTYLKELCSLRSIPKKDITQYDQILWFSDVPREQLCQCIVWDLWSIDGDTSVDRPDVWLEIQRPVLKSPPEVPEDLEPWIKEEVSNSSIEEPGIYDQIEYMDDNSGEWLGHSLDDHPEIFELWMHYIDNKWKPWAEEDQRLQRVQNVYNLLFSIYQNQEKFGEQYEVIVGLGFLAWSSPNSGEIRRHVLTLKARVWFDRIKGIMSVGPALDGPQPALECDMLETDDRPEVADLDAIEEAVEDLNGEPWNGQQLNVIFQMFSNSLSTKSQYANTLERPKGKDENPVVHLSPALILRRRTPRTFVNFYEQIIKRIEEDSDIPENLRRIVEIMDDMDEYSKNNGHSYGSSRTSMEQEDNELYFPLPSNKEQKRIAERIEKRRGLLVQGPPGTGKSHTIVNLISHFLARGKRVLVTSETPRALEVLQGMLPEEIMELCVVWLGTDPESQKSLEKSVNGITQKRVNWNQANEQKQIDQLTKKLQSEREYQAELRNKLRACECSPRTVPVMQLVFQLQKAPI